MNDLIGLKVELHRPSDSCCRGICTIREGKGPHVGELRCADCNRHRGWLNFETACFLESVMVVFGLPQQPVVVDELHKILEGEVISISAQERQRRIYEIRQWIKRRGFELKDFFLSSPPDHDWYREQQRQKIAQLMHRYKLSAHDLVELPSDVVPSVEKST
jgi:hypothetical protein